MDPGLQTLFVVFTLSALISILARTIPGQRIPAVVMLLIAGIAVGPSGLGWAEPDAVELFSDLGLGFLFLLAGYETQLEWFARRSGRLAITSWLLTVAVAVAITGALAAAGLVTAFVPIALALTTTALGTLLPILRENGMLTGRFREYMLAGGAVGELFPIIAIALFLGSSGSFAALASLAAFGIVAVLLVRLAKVVQGTSIERIALGGSGATSQTTLRLTVALLVGLLLLAEDFGIDIVLGAFVAGLILRRWGPAERETFDAKLEAVGYGVFIPVFFIASGMTVDIDSVLQAPDRVLGFLVLMLLARGLPVVLVYRRDLTVATRVQMAFLTATALPLLVAIAHIGQETGVMKPENAAAIVGAGVLSVLVFPLAATALHRRWPASEDFDDSRVAASIDDKEDVDFVLRSARDGDPT
jgi:Kef-type K+ transport system membrane component KefB